MKRMYRHIGLLVALTLPTAAFACATCGCSLSSDAAMGYSDMAGWRVNLDYNYINQDQMRSGSSALSRAQVAALNPAAQQEVENQTINRYLNLGISYSPSSEWNIKAIIPYIDRTHSTWGAATPDMLSDASNLSGSTLKGLGDIKLIGSYQGFLPTHNLGVQLGIKLPTGDYGSQNTVTGAVVGSTPKFFSSGPNAGQAVDASLQPGNGSTDLIIGAYYYQAVSQNFDAFVNGQFQTAISEKLDQANANYRPGNQLNVSAGLRYEADPKFLPQLQINVTHRTSDQGALADTADTAGTVVYLSPGLTASVAKNMQAYGFVQVPIYSHLDGYQLFPHWTATVGLSYAF
jgi:hypothetical protein